MNCGRFGVMCLAGLVLLAGCAPAASRGGGKPLAMTADLGPARDILAACMESMGGMAAWQKVGKIRATAVVTMYDFQDIPFVNIQKLVLDLRAGTLDVESNSPLGTWTLTATTEGYCDLQVSGAWPTDERILLIASTAATLLHRLRGPLNLLITDERPGGVQPTRFAGSDVTRVGVEDDTRWAAAYYFDSTTGLLKYLTSRADEPFSYGTVTLYEYQMLPNGMAFPRTLRVVALGDHAMIGEQVLLEADFTNVVFQ